MIKSDDVRELVRAEPFVPFKIVMAGGETLDAWHREFILAPPGQRTVILVDRERRTRIINTSLIAYLEPQPSVEVE